MGTYSRVVWTEGMFLGPHHFQQAERHLLGEMGYRLQLAVPHAWGVGRLEIDTDALTPTAVADHIIHEFRGLAAERSIRA